MKLESPYQGYASLTPRSCTSLLQTKSENTTETKGTAKLQNANAKCRGKKKSIESYPIASANVRKGRRKKKAKGKKKDKREKIVMLASPRPASSTSPLEKTKRGKSRRSASTLQTVMAAALCLVLSLSNSILYLAPFSLKIARSAPERRNGKEKSPALLKGGRVYRAKLLPKPRRKFVSEKEKKRGVVLSCARSFLLFSTRRYNHRR